MLRNSLRDYTSASVIKMRSSSMAHNYHVWSQDSFLTAATLVLTKVKDFLEVRFLLRIAASFKSLRPIWIDSTLRSTVMDAKWIHHSSLISGRCKRRVHNKMMKILIKLIKTEFLEI